MAIIFLLTLLCEVHYNNNHINYIVADCCANNKNNLLSISLSQA